MSHPNEDRLRQAYALFGEGDMPGFLATCNDDVTFTVPGPNEIAGQRAERVFTKSDFLELVGTVMTVSAGTFAEEVVDVVANDSHGVLLLVHRFRRGDTDVEYRTNHVVELKDGLISRWQEWPGDLGTFAAAWT
jgi:ketosteroid isomerase-like protein